jgi:O-antigen/teichoic acid export membrane protein
VKSKIICSIRNKLSPSNERSLNVFRNILASFGLKGISILISLLLVPLTINYVSPSMYGIWLTLISIVGWVAYFDVGLAHGFRNRFAEAKAINDTILARKLVSTTYVSLILIFSFSLLIMTIINSRLNWGEILNVDQSLNAGLTKVFFILISVFCVQMILNIFLALLTADQKPALSSMINTVGQLISLIMIFILSKTEEGNLIHLSLVLSGIPCITIFIFTIIMFCFSKYKIYSPCIKYIDFSLIKNILHLGGNFFIIQISILFIFQFTNIILLRVQGSEAVTEYNIAHKYFNIIYMVAVIILTPFWSAFTDAYTKKDFIWMKNIYNKLSKIWFIAVVGYIIMLLISPYLYKIWLHNAVSIPFSLSLVMGLYILILSRANLYMYLINGTGKLKMQLIIYLCFAIISMPMLIFSSNYGGGIGVVCFFILVYSMQAILSHIQLSKIINNKAVGIWNK